MAKNNPNPSEIIAYNNLVKSMQKKNIKNQKKKKSSQKFSMSKQMKAKIKTILATGLILLSVEPIASAHSVPTVETPELYAIALPKNDSKITVKDKVFSIDNNSFVIINGDESIAYDELGNLHTGKIDQENFKEIMEITEEEMSNYIIYQVSEPSGVNVRSTGTTEENNIISTVGYQDYVLGYRAQTSTKGDEWISTLSTDGENIYKGYIREDLLQEITIIDNTYNLSQDNLENLMVVNTSSVGNNPLNLRTTPDEFDKRTIMTRIPNGSSVCIIGETVVSGNREWCKVKYTTDDDYIFEGWVALEYLEPYINIDPNYQRTQTTHLEKAVINGTELNASGHVTGIDISGISAKNLKQLLQSGIPETVNSAIFESDINSSQIAGDINFVYMKLGASPYGEGIFQPIEHTNYIEQVKVCEELGIPYGFYYYSTAITEEEAKIELEHIKQKIDDLRKNTNLENNKLEIVIDIELANTNDRQYQGNIEEQTRAKATLINGIQEAGLSDHVLIYGPLRVMKPDLDQIIDLSYLNSLLSNPENVSLWMCSPSYTPGELSSKVQQDIAYAKEQGFSTVAHQVVLDSTVIDKIDINIMDSNHFQKLLNYETSQDKTSSSNEVVER